MRAYMVSSRGAAGCSGSNCAISLAKVVGHLSEAARPLRFRCAAIRSCQWSRQSAIVNQNCLPDWRDNMAKKNKLKDAAVKIGSAVGRADGTAHKAVRVAKQELAELTK